MTPALLILAAEEPHGIFEDETCSGLMRSQSAEVGWDPVTCPAAPSHHCTQPRHRPATMSHFSLPWQSTRPHVHYLHTCCPCPPPPLASALSCFTAEGQGEGEPTGSAAVLAAECILRGALAPPALTIVPNQYTLCFGGTEHPGCATLLFPALRQY